MRAPAQRRLNLALVNSEILEGEMVDGLMRELRRLNILKPSRREVAGHHGTPDAPWRLADFRGFRSVGPIGDRRKRTLD